MRSIDEFLKDQTKFIQDKEMKQLKSANDEIEAINQMRKIQLNKNTCEIVEKKRMTEGGRENIH